jgi:transposase-like protein
MGAIKITKEEKLYKRYVDEGKELVGLYRNCRYKICELSLKVCNIQVGGHGGSKNVYSIKKYALDIGISHHTLRKWLEEHRQVTKKIGIKNPTPEEYKVIRRVFENVKTEDSESKVKNLYKEYSSLCPEDYKLQSQIKMAKCIRNFLQDYSLKELKKSELKILKDLLKICLSELEEY